MCYRNLVGVPFAKWLVRRPWRRFWVKIQADLTEILWSWRITGIARNFVYWRVIIMTFDLECYCTTPTLRSSQVTAPELSQFSYHVTCVYLVHLCAGQEVPTVRFAYFRHLPNQEADIWHSDVFACSFSLVLNKLKYLHGNVYKGRPVKVHISSHCTSSLYTSTSSVDAPSYLLDFTE